MSMNMVDESKLYYQAARIRKIEERIVEIYPSDLIQSPLHLSIGQESLAVGVCANLDPDDQLFTTYRSHAYYLAKGGNLNSFMAELMGRKTGCCQGKGGSMHLADSKVNFMGTSAIVASTLPHAVGAAYANVMQKKSNLVVCVFGDGAADAGIYHESINFAALHELPIIFVLEDNDLAVHSYKSERQSFRLQEHAKSYNLQTFSLEETQDPTEVANFMTKVYSDVRNNKKAAWVRLKAFRYKEHVGISEDFHIGYRNKKDYEIWAAKDPLIKLQLDSSLQAQLDQEIDEAVNFAKNSAFPEISDLYKDVI
jgi:TPP-dependent pyruvate/acetoin dehydrogenase alpha subunit